MRDMQDMQHSAHVHPLQVELKDLDPLASYLDNLPENEEDAEKTGSESTPSGQRAQCAQQ